MMAADNKDKSKEDNRHDMRADCLRVLHDYWGYDSFRGIQSQIIDSICHGRDTLGLMPTGGGKSLTFQVPAMVMDGTCIVVTPLIALMKDQIWHLSQLGINAVAIHSGLSRHEIIQLLENCIYGDVKFLYLSPERLSSPLFLAKLKRINVSFITVDEAHCISQWGYDFRPPYLHISDLRKLKPDVPVLALTATATKAVVADIQNKLAFGEPNVIRMSFVRENLTYVVRETDDKQGQLLHILKAVNGSAIVYTRSRKRTREISLLLETEGMSATFFHAGLATSQKDERQAKWQNGEYRIMVATNAFGMGIDKADVRIVIHYDCPDSLEAYFQEMGRAGRDGKRSYAVLLYNGNDTMRLKKRINEKYPDKEYIRDVYEHLAYFFQVASGEGYGTSYVFDVNKFCRSYSFFPLQVEAALRLLDQCGYIRYNEEPDSSARLRFILERDELYRLHDTSPDEESVITVLLRCYTGLFSDYEYIDEARIAQLCMLTTEQVYLILKGLSHRRIVHFIPRRALPLITYVQRRELADDIIIPRSIYDDRKEQYRKQIGYIIKYATQNEVCRSVYLLRYFGEKTSTECGCCDVCFEHKPDREIEKRMTHSCELILQMLSDGNKHNIVEIKDIKDSYEMLRKALQRLYDEQVIVCKQNYIWLRKKGVGQSDVI